MLVEYESSATIRYKNIGKKIKSGSHIKEDPEDVFVVNFRGGKRAAEEETGRRGKRCQRELKGFGLGKVIGIPRQSASWLRSVGVSWQPSQRA